MQNYEAGYRSSREIEFERMRSALTIILVACLMSEAHASESQHETLIFIGTLESTESTRLIRAQGPSPVVCDASGECWIIVSNSCGTEEARLRTIDTLLGPQLSEVTVLAIVGEWCTPRLPLSRAPVLIWASRQESAWILEREVMLRVDGSGHRVLLPEDDGVIGPVPLSTIRRPLAAPILHSRVGDHQSQRIQNLVEKGILEITGDVVNFRSGILVDDLARALRSDNRLERSGATPAAQPECRQRDDTVACDIVGTAVHAPNRDRYQEWLGNTLLNALVSARLRQQ